MVKCFNCGDFGHKSFECTGAPNPDARPTGNRDGNRDGYREGNRDGNRDFKGTQDRSCYNCNQPGHLARDCTEAPNNKPRFNKPYGGQSRPNNTQKTGSCFKCNQEGHWAKECKAGIQCYKCKNTGHKAFECTAAQ